MRGHYPPEYLEFIRLFNDGRYAESYEALRDAWASNRSNRFYKALIQLAGAVQHWQDASYYWSENLFRGARELLEPYRPHYAGLDIDQLTRLLETCADVARAKRNDREGEYKLPPLQLTLKP
ncbi:MAG TPA: DUF309 domain-containing protein [Limnochordales bacterium]